MSCVVVNFRAQAIAELTAPGTPFEVVEEIVLGTPLPVFKHRLRNLRDHGFPIERVIATGNASGPRSPKADAIAALDPLAFVDDYLPYFRGLPAQVHTALILRAPNGSPNVGDEIGRLAKSTHADLGAFAEHWLGR